MKTENASWLKSVKSILIVNKNKFVSFSFCLRIALHRIVECTYGQIKCRVNGVCI